MQQKIQNQIDPRECQFRLGAAVRKRINIVLNGNYKKEKKDAKKQLEAILEEEEHNKQLLNYDQLTSIHKCLQRLDNKYEQFFFQLLDECKMISPSKRSNEELDLRLRKLQLDKSNKDYQGMTYNIKRRTRATTNISSLSEDFRQVRPILIALLNGVMCIGGSFLFFYKAVEYSLPEPQVPVQVLCGLFAAVIVAIAEIYFFMKII